MNAKEKWLAKQEQERIEREANAKPPFLAVSEYKQLYSREVKGQLLLATYADQSCLPGDYFVAIIVNNSILINDGDDGYMQKDFPNQQAVQDGLQELMFLAPFYLSDLKEFGYGPH